MHSHHRSLFNAAGGLGVLQVPQLLQGRGLVGVQGGEAPGSSENIVFYSTEKGLKRRLKTLSYHGEILPDL